MGNHLDEMKGYQGYSRQAAKLREIGIDKFVDGFLAANAYVKRPIAFDEARLEGIHDHL